MTEKRKKVLLVSSHGGHLTEMVAVREAFDDCDTVYITYAGITPSGLERCHYLPNGWYRNPFKAVAVLYRSLRIVMAEKPDAVFSTGAEIAIPIFLWAKLICGAKLAYMECSAQVTKASLTGKALYPFTDLFLVQWETLAKQYGPKAHYRGGLI